MWKPLIMCKNQVNTWTNVDWSSNVLCGIHLKQFKKRFSYNLNLLQGFREHTFNITSTSSRVQFVSHTPASMKLKGGYTGFTSSVRLSVHLSVCLSICGQNPVRFVTPPILAGSISYLHITYSKFRNFFKFVNLTVLFWFGIWYESIVWVIMGQPEVFSERRCSSCSSWIDHVIMGLMQFPMMVADTWGLSQWQALLQPSGHTDLACHTHTYCRIGCQ